MTVDYEKLDELIVKSVAGSHGSPLNDAHCRNEAYRLALAHGGEVFRYIDRRIQALRKSGRIIYLVKSDVPPGCKAGWYLTDSEKQKQGIQ